jgi:tRNA(fMet)-specific endonuclease VapC
MTLWILDTDHVSLFQTGHPLITQRIQSIDPNSIVVTIVTVEEQMYGRLNRIRRAKSAEELRGCLETRRA